MKNIILLIVIGLFISGCSRVAKMSNLPENDNVEVSREKADEDCEELGKVRGTTSSVKGTAEEALADMKQEAADKGANYVMVEQYSGNKTSVTGLAYKCP